MNCPFAAPGRQVACLALMKQREERPHDDSPCYSCPQRVKRIEADRPPQRINIPTANFGGPGKPAPKSTPPPSGESAQLVTKLVTPGKKEAAVATDMKESVYRQIEKTKSCTQSRITQYTHLKPNELAIIAAELEKEGRIRVWPKDGRNMYSLPGEPDPWAAPMKSEVPVSPPRSREKNRKPATPVVALSASTPNSSVAAMIDQVRRMRDTYNANADAAIAALEALV